MHRRFVFMKEKLTLRNVIVWGAAFLGLLFFFLSFAACASMRFNDGHATAEYTFKNAIWASDYVIAKANGVVIAEGPVTGSPYALPIVGIILVLVGALAAVVISILVKDSKIRMFTLIGAGVVSILGGVFIFFVGESAIKTLWVLSESPIPFDQFKAAYKAAGATWGPNALPIIIGIVAILAGCAYGVSSFLPEKKLAK